MIPTAAAILRYRFRCLNAPAAKHACGPTRSQGSVGNDVCIAPSCGAQAALVRWCAVHHRHGCAQASAQPRASHLEEPKEEAQATTRYCLAYKLSLPWLRRDFSWPLIASARSTCADNHLSSFEICAPIHVSKRADDSHEYLVKVRSRGFPLVKHASRKGGSVYTGLEFLKRTPHANNRQRNAFALPKPLLNMVFWPSPPSVM